MAVLGLKADAELFEDMRLAKDAREAFQKSGKPLEFWEALSLVRAHGQLVRAELARVGDLQAAGFDAGISVATWEKLTPIREQSKWLIRELRLLLARLPGSRWESEELEVALGLFAISAAARAAAIRWVADIKRTEREASQRLVDMTSLLDGYRQALEEHSFDPKSPPEAETETRMVKEAVADSATTDVTHETVNLPKGVDLDILDDLRRIEECRKVFAATHQQIEVWEVFCLVMIDRDGTREALKDLLNLQTEGKMLEFNDGALRLFDDLLEMRSEHGKLVRKLRKFLLKLPVGNFGKDTMEMALGFIIASERGRERANQWLDESERHIPEATGRLEDVINRTLKYQTALRMVM